MFNVQFGFDAADGASVSECAGHGMRFLDPKTQASLKGWNARFLAVITKREISDEHRHPTFNLDL